MSRVKKGYVRRWFVVAPYHSPPMPGVVSIEGWCFFGGACFDWLTTYSWDNKPEASKNAKAWDQGFVMYVDFPEECFK